MQSIFSQWQLISEVNALQSRARSRVIKQSKQAISKRLGYLQICFCFDLTSQSFGHISSLGAKVDSQEASEIVSLHKNYDDDDDDDAGRYGFRIEQAEGANNLPSNRRH